MLSILSAQRLGHSRIDMRQAELPQNGGFKYLTLPPHNNIMESSTPFATQFWDYGPFNNSLQYFAWWQGVQSALMTMHSPTHFTQIHNHPSLLKFSPPTLSEDSFNTHSTHLTDLSCDPVCNPVSRSTPLVASNSVEDSDEPLALVVRKYADTDRLQSVTVPSNMHRNPSPNSRSFSSNSSSISNASSNITSTSRDTLHTRTSNMTRRLRSKLANRHRSQARRMKANARERSRVHTISAAFEALRQIVPTCPTTPRLSKLSVLRVASCYIEALRTCLLENPVQNIEKSE